MAESECSRSPWPDEPPGWWGYRESPSNPLSLIELIASEMLDARVAAFLWIAVEHHATVIVAAPEPRAGKTTLLTALLDLIPPNTTRRYLRGWYERFEFVDQDDPARTYLLCNEISSHLPIYLWGRGVRRLFELLQNGFAMATTVHAGGAREVLDLFRGFPLEVPEPHLASIDLVLTLGVGLGSRGPVRRLMRMEAPLPADGRLGIQVLAERMTPLSPLVSNPAALVRLLAERFGIERRAASAELARRERVLLHWLAQGITSREAVRQAVAAYRQRAIEKDAGAAPRGGDAQAGA
ncbi:type II secretion system protein E [Thermomicrobiaceae bacterium CFH 74404]|uniref:Type II secretion system protein E n=1 Tax=Thermalbibacter longus TaxID=2951981 RepID=A0AA41WF32_9BACT|nr:type II secretion system protein E [Thermalbibacter longus]MCM8749888.1 type II secretion system protein E [Thermalbibacter longus]